jgi:hypothetical protein
VPNAQIIAEQDTYVKVIILVPTWADIDDNNRRIRILKSKTDKATGNVGATIVLPAKAKSLLIALVMALIEIAGEDRNSEWEFPTLDERIFPMQEK